MIIIIIRSLFIISNYFWQPKPLVVAKIYPALINGICWNRILNPTQSLANQVHFLVYTRFLFYHLDRYFEWRYVFSQQIRKYPSGRLLEFQPASQFCLVKMPQFHRWAAEELLARRRLMEEYSQALVRWEEEDWSRVRYLSREWPGSRMLPRLVSSVWAPLSCSAEWWLTESRMKCSGWTRNKMGIRSL